MMMNKGKSKSTKAMPFKTCKGCPTPAKCKAAGKCAAAGKAKKY
jgi:hypothetical protein